MGRVTMSALPRLAVCPASGALPAAERSNPWSEAGTITHRFLERVPQVGRDVALAESPKDHRARLACIELDGLPLGREYEQEVAFAYHGAQKPRARTLGRGLGRDYGGADPLEIPGTADVVGLRARIPYVGDYKTDHGRDELAKPPAENLQIRALALAASEVAGIPEVTAEIIRIRDDGSSRAETVEFDFFALEDVAAEIARVHHAVADAKAQVARGEMPSVRESEYCRYCPAAHVCPARVALLRQAAWTPDDVKRSVLGDLTPEMEQRAYAAWRSIGRLYAELTGAMKQRASENGGIDIGDGATWGQVEKSKDTINGRIAFEVLRELHGEDVAAAAVEIKATKSGLEESLREVKASTGVPLAQLKREALAAISRAGGVTTETKLEFDTFEKASGK